MLLDYDDGTLTVEKVVALKKEFCFGNVINVSKRFIDLPGANFKCHVFRGDTVNIETLYNAMKKKWPGYVDVSNDYAGSDVIPFKSIWTKKVYSGPALIDYNEDIIKQLQGSPDLPDGLRCDASTFDVWFPFYWETHNDMKEIGEGMLFKDEATARKVLSHVVVERPGTPPFRYEHEA